MTLVAARQAPLRALRLPRSLLALLLIAGAGLLAAVVSLAADWLRLWPAEWVLPLKGWITEAAFWSMNDAAIGELRLRDVTRALADALDLPLTWTEDLLSKGFPALGLAKLPWLTVTLAVGILAHWIKGWRLALFCVASCLYLAFFNLWTDAMRTLSLVIVAVPFAILLGLAVGIAARRSRRFDAIATVALDIMQATPHMAYLVPVIAFFGLGQAPGLIATVIFAMPPMARCVTLGLRSVPAEVVEAGRMSGCTQRQLLWMVELPAAKPILLLGLNQVVMQTLAMAVLVALIGVSGLGEKLLFSLQQLQLGKALEQGVAIVLVAIVLDRLTQAYAHRDPAHRDAAQSWPRRHPHLLLFLLATAASLLLALALPELRSLPKGLTVSTAPLWDDGIRWMSKNLFGVIYGVRDWITLQLLLPLRDAFLAVPWVAAVAGLAALAWCIAGRRTALLVVALLLYILLTGLWVPAVMTFYLVTAAVLLCMAIGIPLGIWSAHRPRVARVVLATCDTLQTFPSFIYLIPVVMLLRVGDLANIIAIVAYACVPAIRFTYLGLKRVPAATLEAARASGTSPRQLLWKVELPIALPEIMLGINQTIMMALAMTAITALIGSQDLGQEIYKARPEVDVGRSLLAGLAIAFIGIAADRIIGGWAARRKRQLGLA